MNGYEFNAGIGVVVRAPVIDWPGDSVHIVD
jgi:hypothetical protein